ncbi:MAG: acyl-CoA dehydrogenase family protein [Jatrophihabitans sp.]
MSGNDESRLDILDRIIRDVIAQSAVQVDTEGVFPTEGIQALAEAGFLRLTVPVTDGGYGAVASEFSEVVFRLAKACASTAMVYVMHATALNSVLSLPESEQRTRHLSRICENNLLITEAISEPGSGSQWWSVASTAEKIDGGYHITADKTFSTSAGHADEYVVSTRTPASDNERDHAIFLVRKDQGTIESGVWRGLGLAGNSSTWITFRSEVDASALLYSAADGGGLRRYNEVNQPIYHLGVSSAYLGIATAAYEAALGRVRARRYSGNPAGFGSNLSQYPIARRHIGEMAIRLAGVRGLISELSRRIESGATLKEMAVQMTAAR